MKSNKEHYMTKVNFYDSINDSMLKFAVIIARHNGKWVFCNRLKFPLRRQNQRMQGPVSMHSYKFHTLYSS